MGFVLNYIQYICIKGKSVFGKISVNMQHKKAQAQSEQSENPTMQNPADKVSDMPFEELAKRYESGIRAAAASFNVPSSEREDLYQEGLIALYRAVCNYDKSIARFSTFANVCIRNAMLTWIRDHVSKTDDAGNRITEIPIDEVFGADFPEDSETPEELYISKETLSSLKRKALMCLSDLEKCVFLMYLDNMTAQEIGESLGRSKKSVDNALSRIRRKISEASDKGKDSETL